MKGIGDRRKDYSELVIMYIHVQRAALARVLDPSLTASRHQLVAEPLATLAKGVATAALESSTCFQSPTVQGSAQTSVESSRAVGWMHERRLRRQKQGPLRVAPCFRKSLFLRRRAHFLIQRTFVTSTSHHKSKSCQACHLFLFICKHTV